MLFVLGTAFLSGAYHENVIFANTYTDTLSIEARAIAWMYLDQAASRSNVVLKRSWTPATSEAQSNGKYVVEGKCTINNVPKRYRVVVKHLGNGNWSLEDLQIFSL